VYGSTLEKSNEHCSVICNLQLFYRRQYSGEGYKHKGLGKPTQVFHSVYCGKERVALSEFLSVTDRNTERVKSSEINRKTDEEFKGKQSAF
jgi:hypothetical protein